MTEEKLIRLGCEEGVLPHQVEEMTWGEAVMLITARRERERRRAQNLALIAWEQAGLTAQAVLSGSLPEVYECFPFWTEEERRELKVEKYRRMLEGLAAKKRGGRDEGAGE